MTMREPGQMKPAGKIMIVIVVLCALFGVYKYAESKGMVGDYLVKKEREAKGIVDTGAVKPQFNIGVVTWGGYAGGQLFNKGFKASEESRYFTEYGFKVEFKVLDDFAASREALKSDAVDLLWVTADAFPTETAGLGAFDPVFIFQADWSRGGDAIVATQNINKVNDLLGKKIAVAFGTPSHTFLLAALDSAGISLMDVNIIEVASAIDAAAAFKAKSVDAAVVWSPDDMDCVANVAGSKVLTSTRDAKYIIADGFFVKKAFLEKYETQLTQIVEGWLTGAAEINESPVAKKEAAKILSAGLGQPEDFCLKAIDNVRLTTLGDNMNFFGLNPDYKGVTGQVLYTKMKALYGKINLAPKNTPEWGAVSDSRIISKLKLTGPSHSAEKEKVFTKVDEKKPVTALATKQVSLNFATGSAVLDENAKEIIRLKIGDSLKMFADMRVRLSGHTDNTGSASANRVLSSRRAQAVADFLAIEYSFQKERFLVAGFGPDKPVADNATEEGRAKNRRTEIDLIIQ